MGKRGQMQSFDFIVGLIVFLSVLSFLSFFILPKAQTHRDVGYSTLQSMWFDLESFGFLDGPIIDESVLRSINYSLVKDELLLPLPFGVSNADFCFFSFADRDFTHFGPNSSALWISKNRSCGGPRRVTKAIPSCRGNFTAARSLSRPGYSLDKNKFVQMTLLLCVEGQ